MPDAHERAVKGPPRPDSTSGDASDPAEFARLKRRLARERAARLEMETIYERGLRELYMREQELRLLQDIATASNVSQSLREVFQYGLTRICEYMVWPVGHVFLAENHAGSIRLGSLGLWHLREPDKTAPFRAATEARTFAPGEGLPGRVYRSGRPAWASDVGKDAAFARAPAAASSGLKAACAIPILAGKETVAIVEFYADHAIERDRTLLKLMPQVGTHLARVIERQRAEDRLVHDASHDPLTALPNRALFLDRLDQAIARSKRKPQARFAVMFIDLDRFKVVNDSLGHQAGDRLLVLVADRLKGALSHNGVLAAPDQTPAPERGTLARLGGDEFVVLLQDINGPSDAVRVATRVAAALQRPFVIDEQDIYTSASTGIAPSAARYQSADAVLRDADIAMYQAKSLGKARCVVFDQEMHAAATRRLALETELRQAVDKREFVLQYQPIVSLESNEVAGFEALVRWLKPDGNLVYPAEFVAVTEETGLILELGHWVLREACRATRSLQQQCPRDPPLTMSINVSPRQFAQHDFVPRVRAVIAETGVDPGSLRLEITENITIDDTRRVAAVLKELQHIGVRFSIDDFGTGYSSLSYLHSLPLDLLKIDKSFIAAMHHNAESLQIVRTIVSLARNLGMDVVAEGTEVAAQVSQLQALGCDFGQGYYFSRAVDLADASALLKRPRGTLKR